jgi:hypothetical protein
MRKLAIATALIVAGILTGLWSPTAAPVAHAAQLIGDGDFEGNRYGINYWTGTSPLRGTPYCDIRRFRCAAEGPRNGNGWALFGGFEAPETSTLGQTVLFPLGGTATLTF